MFIQDPAARIAEVAYEAVLAVLDRTGGVQFRPTPKLETLKLADDVRTAVLNAANEALAAQR